MIAIVSDDLSLNRHISLLAERAGKAAASVPSVYLTRNKVTYMMTLYISLIRSHLEI